MIQLAAQIAKRIAATCTILAIVAPAIAQPIPTAICCNTACVCISCTCGPSCDCCQVEATEQTTQQLTLQTQSTPSLPTPANKLQKSPPLKDLQSKNHNPRGPPHT